ncbi:hypothetical protein V1511DRAFT_349306 [Dipodascopsis uninucleata]
MADSDIPVLPKAISDALQLEVISQGAEALVYFSRDHPYMSEDILSNGTVDDSSPSKRASKSGYIVKYRPAKPYRLPLLDSQLTKRRTLAEARVLYRLFLAGVKVPMFIAVDTKQGLIWMENIKGSSLKKWIWGIEEEILREIYEKLGEEVDSNIVESEMIHRLMASVKPLLLTVGSEISKLHFLDTVHGDLTTSNILLRSAEPDEESSLRLSTGNIEASVKRSCLTTPEPVIIDFGLAQQSTLPEDKAVDLYVLERAFLSTHPIYSKHYVDWVLEGYVAGFGRGKKTAVFKVKEIMKKLDVARLRGRKRSMVG